MANRFSAGVDAMKDKETKIKTGETIETGETEAVSENVPKNNDLLKRKELNLAKIGTGKKKVATLHTFYIDDDVFEKIKYNADARGVSVSAFVTEAFRQLL